MAVGGVAEIFRALSDPVRLEMVRRLARDRPCTVSDVCRGLGITRQGARKHLQLLVDAKLVALEPRGREVLVHPDPSALDEAQAFIAELGRQWETRLDALRRFVEEG
jgi:DNA-binding transcriptional ArsR family regulator